MSDHLAPPTAEEAREALNVLSFEVPDRDCFRRRSTNVMRDFIDHHAGCKERADWLVEIIEEVTKDD